MTNNNTPLLEMRNIKKDFFGNQVLTDINFTLYAGEVLGLVGENGAGKSTLMKLLFGMDVIRETGGYSGDVLINGGKVNFSTPFDALNAGIGMVHQEFSLIPGFTATENILLNREPKKKNIVSEIFGDRLDTLNYKEMAERSKRAIDKMGVKIDADMVISDMPVGHKQFTEIARELSKDQLKLLILDEPTAVLTEKEAEALLESIRGMAAKGIAVIFITHRLHEILSVCDKVVIMRDGYVVKDAPASETDVADITKWMVGRNIQNFALLFGGGYGWLLNKIKGGEMMIATYVGFSSVSFMCMMWLLLPYNSPTMVWGLAGKGLRTTISLEGFYDKALANFLQINIGHFSIPVGSLLFFAVLAFMMWAFLHTQVQR